MMMAIILGATQQAHDKADVISSISHIRKPRYKNLSCLSEFIQLLTGKPLSDSRAQAFCTHLLQTLRWQGIIPTGGTSRLTDVW